MRPNSAHLIKRHAETEVKTRHNYSGRGMFDKTTHAVGVKNMAEFAHAIANAASELEPGSMEAIDFCEDMRRIRQDDMGLGFVFY